MQTIGERLEEARKRKGVSIREAAEATKIRGDYLHKFENNQFDIKLPEIYVRGFLRTYSSFLKLPAEKIINDYKSLGLAEPRSRGLNRESFGRMEISVASAKPPGRDAPPSAAAPVESGAAAAPADGNPATFRPRAGASPQIDRALIVKGGIALVALVLLVVLVVWGARALGGGGSASSPGTKAASGVLVPPVPGEPVITVHALAPVTVSLRLTAGEGQTLFSGRLSAGETRVVPHRGTVRVEADPPSAVELEIGGRRYPMPARAADVEPPRSATPPAR
jgi:cytoskeleton protein RodZ